MRKFEKWIGGHDSITLVASIQLDDTSAVLEKKNVRTRSNFNKFSGTLNSKVKETNEFVPAENLKKGIRGRQEKGGFRLQFRGIPYQCYCFYIAANDLRSGHTLQSLCLMFSVTGEMVPGSKLLVTTPKSHRFRLGVGERSIFDLEDRGFFRRISALVEKTGSQY